MYLTNFLQIFHVGRHGWGSSPRVHDVVCYIADTLDRIATWRCWTCACVMVSRRMHWCHCATHFTGIEFKNSLVLIFTVKVYWILCFVSNSSCCTDKFCCGISRWNCNLMHCSGSMSVLRWRGLSSLLETVSTWRCQKMAKIYSAYTIPLIRSEEIERLFTSF